MWPGTDIVDAEAMRVRPFAELVGPEQILGLDSGFFFIVRTEEGPMAVYCQESPENWFEDFGSGEIRRGRADVQLARDYLLTVTVDGVLLVNLEGAPPEGTVVTETFVVPEPGAAEDPESLRREIERINDELRERFFSKLRLALYGGAGLPQALYDRLQGEGFSVLYDDRSASAGVKFNDADLIGIPLRIVVGSKSLAEGKVEIKERRSGKVQWIALDRVGGAEVEANSLLRRFKERYYADVARTPGASGERSP